ncbi:hypothetical protein TDB9533_01751 [Thalassocella blandensis]|nr:hypothetical protein TDB9533_01751 [Thalassocella blandensis]
MKSYLSSVKREFWEYRGAFLRLPIIAAAALTLLMITALVLYSTSSIRFVLEGDDILRQYQDKDGIYIQMEPGHIDQQHFEALVHAKEEIKRAKQELEKLESNPMLEKAKQELDQQLLSIEKNLQMPEAPEAPGALQPPAPPELPGDIDFREFPSTTEVIGQTDEIPFTKENIEKVNAFVKSIFALFSGIMFLVSFHYLLNCLFTDRKDNSILFWKSLPVSEAQNVLVKFAIATLALPFIAIAAAFVVSIAYAILGMIAVAIFSSTTTPWQLLSGLEIFSQSFFHGFTMIGVALWSAPLFAWVLFCSACAKRSPFLLAVLPVAAIALVEKILFGSQIFIQTVIFRIPGVIFESSQNGLLHFQESNFSQFVHFIGRPGLWLGLILCAGLVYASIWLRDHRYEVK